MFLFLAFILSFGIKIASSYQVYLITHKKPILFQLNVIGFWS